MSNGPPQDDPLRRHYYRPWPDFCHEKAADFDSRGRCGAGRDVGSSEPPLLR